MTRNLDHDEPLALSLAKLDNAVLGELAYAVAREVHARRTEGRSPIMRKLKSAVPTRDVLEIGPGDFVKVDDAWLEVTSNSAYNLASFPRQWFIKTSDGGSYSMVDIERYAKAIDFE